MNHKNTIDPTGLVNDIIDRAIELEASDIHFEPTAGELQIKYRLDGMLKTVETLPAAVRDTVIARLKVMAGLLTYRNDIPQEGRIEEVRAPDSPAGRVLDKRLSVFPTIHGQRAVVRLFYENAELNSLDSLGFSPWIADSLKAIAAGSQGILLLTGPAGSGKSTTLAAMLEYIQTHTPGRSIVTLEDPVERILNGITQIQIPPHGELTFPRALRSLLRQDPEVLMIGEIRDAETAAIAVEAGLTGHLLMTTLHSGSAAAALLRLIDMGIEPYQLTSGVLGILNQRLLRKLCPECRRQDPQSGAWIAVGCKACMQTGYRGRVLASELVEPTADLRKAILAKADMEQLQEIIVRSGRMTLRQSALQLAGQGLTTPEEVRRVCGQDRSEQEPPV